MKVLILTEKQDTSMAEIESADIVAVRKRDGYEVVRLYKVFIGPRVFSKSEFHSLVDSGTQLAKE